MCEHPVMFVREKSSHVEIIIIIIKKETLQTEQWYRDDELKY